MRPIDADALKEAFADVLDKNYMDDYAKGFVAGLNVILNMPTLPQPSNEALTCAGCVYRKREGWNYEQFVRCKRHWGDRYRRPPEGEA
jgi:hypothetical protein